VCMLKAEASSSACANAVSTSAHEDGLFGKSLASSFRS
jgi:hypothetical protein